MRVTHGFMYQSLVRNIMENTERLARANIVAGSGKQVQQASDDPIKAASIMQLRSRLLELDQYERNMGEAEAWLGETESALTAQNELFQRARALTVQAMNDTNSIADREAIAVEIDGLRGALGAISNRTFADKYIFAGTSYSAPAFTGAVYDGDSSPINREIAPSVRLDVGVSGDKAFNVGGASVAGEPDFLTMIEELAAAVRAGNQGSMNTGMGRIDNASRISLDLRTEIGAKQQLIDRARTDLIETNIHLTSLRSMSEDVDMAKAITDLTIAQTAYEVSLAVTGKSMQVSLMDFLR